MFICFSDLEDYEQRINAGEDSKYKRKKSLSNSWKSTWTEGSLGFCLCVRGVQQSEHLLRIE